MNYPFPNPGIYEISEISIDSQHASLNFKVCSNYTKSGIYIDCIASSKLCGKYTA